MKPSKEETKVFDEEWIGIHSILINHLENIVGTPYNIEYYKAQKENELTFKFKINWLISGEMKPTGNPKMPYDYEYGLNPDIYELLIRNPLLFRKNLEKAIRNRFKDTGDKEIRIIFNGFPQEQNPVTQKTNADYIRISHIRPKDIRKGKYLQGIIKRKSTIKIMTDEITRKCDVCGYEQTNEYDETQDINYRVNCPECYRQNKIIRNLKIIDEKKSPIFTIELEEDPEETDNQELHRINIIMKEAIANIITYEETKIGEKIRIFGLPRLIKKDKEKNMETIVFEALGVETNIEKTKMKTELTTENKKRIEEIKGSKVKYFSENLFTNIQGLTKIKESIIVQLVGNPQIKSGNKITRGVLHMLIIGDTGSAKSTFLKLTEKYAIKVRYTTGGGSSACGLLGGVSKDELTGSWVAEAGAIPLCNKGICLIDEIDKINEDDIKKMHEAMEQCIVSIDKANIHTTLPAETSILGAGNPKYGNIDEYKEIYEQIELPIPFINRFDLIWILIDKYNQEQDKKIAQQIIFNLSGMEQKEEPVELFKQYITTAKNIQTKMSQELQEQIINWYEEIRRKTQNQEQKNMRLNARSIESLIRLTLAHARAEMKVIANQDDFDWAKNIFLESIRYISTDPITGNIDVTMMQTGISHSENQIINIILQAIANSPQKELTYQDIRNCIDTKVSDITLDKLLARMKKEGDIFESRNGIYNKI